MATVPIHCIVWIIVISCISKHSVEGTRTVEIRVDKLNALRYEPPQTTCCFTVQCACSARVQACLFDQEAGSCPDGELQTGPQMGGLAIGRTQSLLFLDTIPIQDKQNLGLRVVFTYGPDLRQNHSVLGHYRLDIKGLPLGPNRDEVGWTTFELDTVQGVTATLQVKMYCARGHFGEECSRRCVPQANRFYCSHEGTRKCLGLWSGPECDTQDPCLSYPCLNAGTCHHIGGNDFTCECNPLYTGRHCSMGINSCGSAPCHHAATCIDLVDGYRCVCPMDRTGVRCETEINDCRVHGCRHSGRCLRSLTRTAFECVCPKGYSGERCQNPVCHVRACQNGGRCHATGGGSFRCQCVSGFTGNRCERRTPSPCDSSPCVNDGICLTTGSDGSFRCQCVVSGFTGSLCETREPSPCDPNPCQNGGQCVSDNGRDYSCHCQNTRHKGDRCHIRDPCTSSPCGRNGVCQSASSGEYFTCDCMPSFTGKFCSEQNPCFHNPCLNAGSCSRLPGTSTISGNDRAGRISSFECACRQGYSGRLCEVADPCLSSPCSNGAECRNIMTTNFKNRSPSFSCACKDGFIGYTCETYDVCRAFENPCRNGGRCVSINRGQGYFCQCAYGYKGDSCEVASSCLSKPCLNGGSCRDSPLTDSYVCICPSSFFGNRCELRQFLSSNPNPCSRSVNPCGKHATCRVCDIGDKNCGSSQNVNFTCSCSKGYTGSRCDEEESCLSNPKACKNGGVCVPGNRTHFCVCPSGLRSRDCNDSSNPCLPNPCLNNGVCTSIYSTRFINSMTRIQPRGYYYQCECPPGFTGERCDLIDNCFISPCLHGGMCMSKITGNQVDVGCKCVKGYIGPRCEIKLSCRDYMCQNNGRCAVSYGSGYSQDEAVCSCPYGFGGDFCDRVLDCREVPCLNRGVCVESGGKESKCDCLRGFIGERCETRVGSCSSSSGRSSSRRHEMSCLNGGVCKPVGGVWDEGLSLRHRSPRVEAGRMFDDNEDVRALSTSASSRCVCRPGFTGVRCEVLLSPKPNIFTAEGSIDAAGLCHINPCRNGGRCVRGRDVHAEKCECLKGWTGKHCHIWEGRRGLCRGLHCSGRGVCYQGNDGQPACLCDRGFGRQCEHSCSKQTMGELFPHPTDCSQYVICVWGIPYAMSCPGRGLHFNPKLGLCDWSSRTECGREGGGIEYGGMWWRLEV